MDASNSLTTSTTTGISTPDHSSLTPPPPRTSNLPEISPALSNQPATQAQNNNPNLRFCRICLESEQVANNDIESGQNYNSPEPTAAPKVSGQKNWSKAKNPLIHPCNCHGTMKYIHVQCLERWRRESPRPESYYRCDTCHYSYNLSRPYWASIISHRFFQGILAGFLVIFLWVVVAYMAKVFDVFVLKHTPRPYDPEWVEFHGRTMMWMDLFYLIIGFIIISVLGLVSFIGLACSNGWIDVFDCNCGYPRFFACSCDSSFGDNDCGIAFVFLIFIFLIILIIIGFICSILGVYFAVRGFTGWVCDRVVDKVIEV